MEWVLLIVLVICGGLYLTDRKGWNATAKRLSTIVRAHLESAKPLKKLDKVDDRKALDAWTAEFEGKSPETEEKHVIVKTWFGMYGGELTPMYKCKCGYSDWGIDIRAAQRKAQNHVREQNAAEDLMKKNGGTHAW